MRSSLVVHLWTVSDDSIYERICRYKGKWLQRRIYYSFSSTTRPTLEQCKEITSLWNCARCDYFNSLWSQNTRKTEEKEDKNSIVLILLRMQWPGNIYFRQKNKSRRRTTRMRNQRIGYGLNTKVFCHFRNCSWFFFDLV